MPFTLQVFCHKARIRRVEMLIINSLDEGPFILKLEVVFKRDTVPKLLGRLTTFEFGARRSRCGRPMEGLSFK